MPLKTDELCRILAKTLQEEHRFLQQISEEGIFSINQHTLKYICGKAIFKQAESIFGTHAIWQWNQHEINKRDKPLLFSYLSPDNENHNLYADVLAVNKDDDLVLQIQPMLQNLYPHKKLVAILVKCTEKQAEVWIEKWTENIGKILITAEKPIRISSDESSEQTWLICWKDATNKETADIHTNADSAMEDAINDMYFESMLMIIKRIISLRTNLDEAQIKTQTRLATIFKMVFAKEQGVSLEEVYDPEAMAGLTDSELATRNFINDMQKTFNISFNETEIQHIVSIKDLAGIIIHKKSHT